MKSCDDYVNWVEYELDQRDSIPSWTTAIHDRVTETARACFRAGISIPEAADECETEAWRLWSLQT